jgi:hypothetical protein
MTRRALGFGRAYLHLSFAAMRRASSFVGRLGLVTLNCTLLHILAALRRAKYVAGGGVRELAT